MERCINEAAAHKCRQAQITRSVCAHVWSPSTFDRAAWLAMLRPQRELHGVCALSTARPHAALMC